MYSLDELPLLIKQFWADKPCITLRSLKSASRNDNETIVPGVAPDSVIVGALHSHETHMGGTGIQIVQRLNQAIGKVLVEEASPLAGELVFAVGGKLQAGLKSSRVNFG